MRVTYNHRLVHNRYFSIRHLVNIFVTGTSICVICFKNKRPKSLSYQLAKLDFRKTLPFRHNVGALPTDRQTDGIAITVAEDY